MYSLSITQWEISHLPVPESSHVAACLGCSLFNYAVCAGKIVLRLASPRLLEGRCGALHNSRVRSAPTAAILLWHPATPIPPTLCTPPTLATLHTWPSLSWFACNIFLWFSLHTSRLCEAVNLHAKWRVQHFAVFPAFLLFFPLLLPRIQLPNCNSASCCCCFCGT